METNKTIAQSFECTKDQSAKCSQLASEWITNQAPRYLDSYTCEIQQISDKSSLKALLVLCSGTVRQPEPKPEQETTSDDTLRDPC